MKLGTTDLETATIISLEDSEKLVNQSIQLFGSELTHIFIVFLSILIDDTVFENLSTNVVHKKIEIPVDSKITLKVVFFSLPHCCFQNRLVIHFI
jgi:hypothetical protein